jgi:hypothetical protein
MGRAGRGAVMGIFGSRPPSEREAAEKKLARSGIPEHESPSPAYRGRFANYVVADEHGRDRSGVRIGYVIPPGGKSYPEEMDELDDRADREDWGEL